MTADWVLDLGPGGGFNGGAIVAKGTPEVVAGNAKSFIGVYLKPMLERAPMLSFQCEIDPEEPKEDIRRSPGFVAAK